MPDDFDPPPSASLADHGHITGPFLHGTRAALAPGDLVLPGRPSHFRPARPLDHVYFTTRSETVAWGAELAASLAPSGDDGGPETARVYEVEPLGRFEDDPNVTDRKFPGNPTRSYRSATPSGSSASSRTGPGIPRRSCKGCSRRWRGSAPRAWTSSRTSPGSPALGQRRPRRREAPGRAARHTGQTVPSGPRHVISREIGQALDLRSRDPGLVARR